MPSDDWRNICTTRGAASSSDITADAILDVMRRFASVPRPDFDALILLPAAWDAVQKMAPPAWQSPLPDGLEWSLYGLPFYRASSIIEATTIAADLKAKGKRPVIVTGTFMGLPITLVPGADANG